MIPHRLLPVASDIGRLLNPNPLCLRAVVFYYDRLDDYVAHASGRLTSTFKLAVLFFCLQILPKPKF